MGIYKDMYDKIEEEKELIKNEIENFILYAFSDDSERKQFLKCLDDYMEEVYEHPGEEDLE